MVRPSRSKGIVRLIVTRVLTAPTWPNHAFIRCVAPWYNLLDTSGLYLNRIRHEYAEYAKTVLSLARTIRAAYLRMRLVLPPTPRRKSEMNFQSGNDLVDRARKGRKRKRKKRNRAIRADFIRGGAIRSIVDRIHRRILSFNHED